MSSRSRATSRIAALFAAGLLASGASCAAFTLDVPEVCVTQSNVSMPGVRAASSRVALQGDVSTSFTLNNLGDVKSLMPSGLSTSVHLSRLTIKPVSGVSSLDFVRTVDIKVGGATAASASLVDVTRCSTTTSTCADATGAVKLPGNPSADLAGYVEANALRVQTTVGGSLPDRTWTVDVQTCLSVETSYDVSL